MADTATIGSGKAHPYDRVTEAQALWASKLDRIVSAIGPERDMGMLALLQPIGVEVDILVLRAPSKWVADQVHENLSADIEKIVARPIRIVR